MFRHIFIGGIEFSIPNFGFYLHTQADDIFYSEDELNGGNPQALIYGGNSQQLDLDLSPAAAATKIVTFDSDSIIIAWEDLPLGSNGKLGDQDYEDLIGGLLTYPDGTDIPEPMTMALLGSGLGIMFILRKRNRLSRADSNKT